MQRWRKAALSRLAASQPIQTCCSLCSRLGFSSQATTSIEPETIDALPRSSSGRHACNRLRKDGQTPAIIFSLPKNESMLISIDSHAATSMPRVVHINSVSNAVENITFMHCPPERQVVVPIPVQVIGEDACPGIKQNGFPYLIRRYVDCLCPGHTIPPAIEVDVSGLDLGQKVLLPQLKLPEGVRLAALHPQLPVCKIAGKGNRAGSEA